MQFQSAPGSLAGRPRTGSVPEIKPPGSARIICYVLAVVFASWFVLSLTGVVPGPPPPKGGSNVESVTVDDTTGWINESRLKGRVEKLDFHDPTKVAVYVIHGGPGTDVNQLTLDYAKIAHPEWLSPKPEDEHDYWADGMFIITLALDATEPEGHGEIGTYFGENIHISQTTVLQMHKAAADNLHQKRWTDGIVDVAAEGADVINRPLYESPVPLFAGLIFALVVAFFALRRSWALYKARRAFDAAFAEGTQHLTQVTMDLDETEIAARTLPTGSRYASELERRFADFIRRYRAVSDQRDRLQAIASRRSRAYSTQAADTFAEESQQLDRTDDAIMQASALYTRSPAWRQAWAAQVAPVMDDVARLYELEADVTAGSRAQFQALLSWAAWMQPQLETIGTDLEQRKIDVDTALDRVAELRSQLTGKLEEFAEAQIQSYAQNRQEENLMRAELYRSRRTGSGLDQPGSILDSVMVWNTLWTVSAFRSAYDAGSDSVSTARAFESSGGLTSGYSGGGSFSGSGGSSSF